MTKIQVEIRETPMLKSFLPDTLECSSTSVQLGAAHDPVSRREFIKVIVVGSPIGVTKITHTLYRLGFAQVSEWSPPVPTANSGEVMRVLRRCVFID